MGCFCAERPPLRLIFLSSLWDVGVRLVSGSRTADFPGQQTTAPTPMYSLEWVDVQGVSTLIRARKCPAKKRGIAKQDFIDS